MGVTTIAWTDYSWNPWWGCVKVSPGCASCYAETFDRRTFGTSKHVTAKGETREPHWGIEAPRRFFGDKHWNEPFKWNREAEAAGVRKRVFCASMADVFEDRRDLDGPRDRLWDLIHGTPHLDWLLLTKRPENVNRLSWWSDGRNGAEWPRNIWLGTTCEDQLRADERIPHLLAVPAAVRFLSVEPMLGPVDLSDHLLEVDPDDDRQCACHINPPCSKCESPKMRRAIDLVIVGGESGHGRRELATAWIDDVVGQCEAAGVAVFVKQDSGPKPGEQGRLSDATWAHKEFPR